MSKETKDRTDRISSYLCPIFVEDVGNTDSENMLNPLNRFTDAGRAGRQAGKPKT